VRCASKTKFGDSKQLQNAKYIWSAIINRSPQMDQHQLVIGQAKRKKKTSISFPMPFDVRLCPHPTKERKKATRNQNRRVLLFAIPN